jgi:hypothetical protein
VTVTTIYATNVQRDFYAIPDQVSAPLPSPRGDGHPTREIGPPIWHNVEKVHELGRNGDKIMIHTLTSEGQRSTALSLGEPTS